VRRLGADHVIDYEREDLTRSGRTYDLVFDIGGTRRLGELARVMQRDGTLVMAAPDPGQWLGPLVRVALAVLRTKLGRRRFVPFLSSVALQDLQTLKDLVEAGQVRPVIDRCYPLREVPEAIRQMEAGRVAGKLAITVAGAGR
jgi:NADPH:quinone reductase-like Zn-dependent oxidoreductase